MDSDGDAVGAAARRRPLDFARINAVALSNLPALLHRWLPGGKTRRGEYTVCNPRRVDKHPGSFRINVHTGKWSDFATDDNKGGDPISLAAYLSGLTQYEAAFELASMLGLENGASNLARCPSRLGLAACTMACHHPSLASASLFSRLAARNGRA